MMMEAFGLQFTVDNMIKDKISKPFHDTIHDRKIAFHVELCELANEVGFFKYWKKSHVRNDERIKDEWADCLAFLNSISITYNFENELNQLDKLSYIVTLDKPEYYFNNLQRNRLYDFVDIECAYKDLFKMGITMGYSLEELFKAYEVKCQENIRRAKEGY